jgi:response regulator RpfG family c-di-GMP phosphodiesterase
MLTAVANTPSTAEPGVVLFVDDERRVLTSMKAMFRKGYRVLTANSGQEGLEIIGREAVDVVVSDQRMPGMTGVEMLTEIKDRSPHTMRILLTGYADLEAIEASINDCEVFRYLMKPCPPDQLRGAVAQALEAARAGEAEGCESVPPSADVVVLHGSPTSLPERAAAAAAAGDANPPLPEANLATPEPVARDIAADLPAPSNDERWDGDAAGVDIGAAQGTRVDVLVLSHDNELLESICDSAQTLADETRVHRAAGVSEALDVLASEPIGVLITDIAVSEEEVTALTTELKREVPALVTILAADRSDSGLLIDLINHGQVFRFLLKPIPVGQCRLWLTSARRRHLELAASAAERLRYQPELADDESEPAATTPEDVAVALGDEDVTHSGEDATAEDEAGATMTDAAAEDHSTTGIRSRIGRRLSRLKSRFSKWGQRNG